MSVLSPLAAVLVANGVQLPAAVEYVARLRAALGEFDEDDFAAQFSEQANEDFYASLAASLNVVIH